MNAGLTAPEPAASQRELEQLREDMRRMDDVGTRGVGAVQIQLTDAIKDIGELRADLKAHQVEHKREEERRAAGRRWAIGSALGAGTLLVAMLGLLIDIAGHLHG